MKSILEAAYTEIGAVKKRTIRSLAMGDIAQADCDYITKRLEEVISRVELINQNKRRED
jgi:hypothetical protein